MDYWRSFRIKISHRDTYTRNHYIWRHLLCIYLFTNLMYTITIFNVLRVSLTDSVQYVLIHIRAYRRIPIITGPPKITATRK